MLALGLNACGQGVNQPASGLSGVLTAEQRTQARSVPASASAEYTIAGVTAPLAGGFTLTVGPDTGHESYTFTGHAAPASPTQVIQLNGRFDLRGALAPGPLREGIITQYDASSSPGLDWLLDNRGSFNVVRNNGAVESYAIRTAEFRIDSDGLLVGEFRGVDHTRITGGVILPGTDLIVQVRGRVLGVCRVRLSSPPGTTGPVAVDPTNSSPRCAEMFSGL